jgi:preprotein translocase SecE subunit
MARNRQRAKQRQAERRASRIAQAGADTAPPIPEDPDPELLEEAAHLAAGAPPEDEGRSDTVLEEPSLEEEEEILGESEAPTREREVERDGRSHRRHGRVIAFLIAVWAELKRVQWPDRQTLTVLTGVVLLFVLIMGGYLGLLDAAFSRLIQAIL